jgi:Sugar-transfer associated ATP-grasp
MTLAEIRALAHYGFPFSVSDPHTSVARLRALGFPARYAARRLKPLLGRASMTMAWPIGAFLDALRHARVVVAEDRRVPFFATLCDIYRLALSHNIPPLEYALYRLHEPAHRADMHHYLYWTDLPALGALNARRGANPRDVQDKHRFADICARATLPHMETLAAFDRGRQVAGEEPFAPMHPRLFVKSLRGKGSMGAECWTREGDRYRNTQRTVVRAPELAEVLRQSDCIVQPYCENHSSLVPITNGALACLRILTGIDRAGHTELIWAMLSLPFGALKSSTGGIVCRLAPETGTMTRAITIGTGRDAISHPDTGALLIGITVPFWRDSIALATRAHATAFSRFAFLGWDVALTETGPVLLETNGGWGALHHQMLDGPIGHTAFSRLVEEHLNACA